MIGLSLRKLLFIHPAAGSALKTWTHYPHLSDMEIHNPTHVRQHKPLPIESHHIPLLPNTKTGQQQKAMPIPANTGKIKLRKQKKKQGNVGMFFHSLMGWMWQISQW